ncbi:MULTISPECIES: helix-turn-helix domain-containing protein [Pontibacillus]|uniref:Helix-turn-helix transcriptional regulator n=1 Tax=Pontibacillus chungwhensis TaxID=265426 RepID=A0ABY8UXZ6_9BACI|nr:MULTISPECIES: helix-turn-helix transcriptional regulator [Pontibacillus]MCD5325129.1 helix-turn-helix transcriptional regulator [Pontibacillus sp. HN14]WIF97379.1 helix-turn-helix transcriptional regulator [Pontibacillus chungwhensis]
MSLGKQIRKQRERLGLSLEEFAVRVRTGQQTIERIEKDEHIPELQTILRISTVLDMPASELLESTTTESEVDEELKNLIMEVGVKRTKLFLRHVKEFSEDDVLKVMEMLKEIKYKN